MLEMIQMRLFALFAIAFVTTIGQNISEECRNTDIKSIIGGRDYAVDEMRGIHFVHAGRDQLLVFGRLTQAQDGVSKAFLFLHDYLYCYTTDAREFNGANEGFKEAYVEDGYINLLGYHAEKGVRSEVVTNLAINRILTNQWSVTLTDNTQTLRTDFKRQAINYGFMTTNDGQLMVVDSQEIRLYSFTDNTAQSYTAQDALSLVAAAKSFYFDEKFAFYDTQGQSELLKATDYIVLLRADNTSLKLLLLNPVTMEIVATSQIQTEDSSKSDARMSVLQIGTEATAVIALNQDTLRILRWTISLTGSPSQKLQITLNKRLKVIFMSYRDVIGSDPTLRIVAVDQDNAMRLIEINLDQNPQLVMNQASRPLDYISFDKVLPRGAASPNLWDYWFFGVTETMSLYGEPFLFSKSVGFIMSTEKNKLSSLWELFLDDLTISLDDRYEAIDVPGKKLDRSNNEVMTQPDIFLPFRKKNGWIFDQVYNCRADLGIQDVDSECLLYTIYDTPEANYLDLQTLSKQVPRERSLCDQTARLQYNRYEGLSLGEKAIRHVCFPYQFEYLSSQAPPATLFGEPMVIVDRNLFQLVWIDKGAPELTNKYWVAHIEELTDDLSQKGFIINAKYKLQRVGHFNVFFEASNPKKFAFFPEEQASDFEVSVSCWSPWCPSYIKQNEYSLYPDITNERVVSNSYVYYIEATQLSKLNITRYTVSFKVVKQPSANSKTASINITGNFWEWYEANKNFISFYAPPTPSNEMQDPSLLDPSKSKSITSSRAEGSTQESMEFLKTSLQAKLNPSVFESVKLWSDNEILLALQEARERLNRKTTESFPKATLDQQGLLTVSFQSDIGMPSYLQKEIKELLSEQLEASRTLRRDRRLGLFKQTNYDKEPTDSQSGVLVADRTIAQLGGQWANQSGNQGGSNEEESIDTTTNENSDSSSSEEGSDDATSEEGSDNETPEEGSDDASPAEGEDFAPEDWDQMEPFPPDGPPGLNQGPECDFENDPECGHFNPDCDPEIDPECGPGGGPGGGSRGCDPMDEECPKFGGGRPPPPPIEFAPAQGIMCDQNDPRPQCQKLPVVTKKTCPETQYLEEQTNTCVYLQIYFGSFEELFEVDFIQADTQQSTQAGRALDVQLKKKLVSASDRQLVMQLEFTNPIEVTPNDYLRIRTNFGAFNPGITVDERKFPCTRQAMNNTATQVVDSISTASKAAVLTASAGSALLQTFMRASLSQLWGMINGIQYINHIPCINLDLPANSFIAQKQLIAIATFELPYVNLEQALNGNWRVQQQEVLTDMPPNVVSSMDQLGYNDPNISISMGTVYVVTVATIVGLIAILITLPLKRLKWCGRVNSWLCKKLLWNFVIRLVFEESLETSYSVALTFKYSKFTPNAFGSAVDYIFSVILTASIAIMPFFLLIFYLRNFQNWESEDFDDLYGAPLDGMKKNQKSSLFYPIYFVIRRVLFCLTTLFLHQYVILELLIHFLLTMTSIVYLTNFHPYEKVLEQRLELMNEFFTVLVIDLCFLFTDLDPDRHRQYNWGYVLIVVILICVGVHVYFLFRGMIKDMLQTIKKARKKGWIKTFKILRKVHHILQVLACRTKLDLQKLRKKDSSSSEESDQKERDRPLQMSVITESEHEDQESVSQPSLLLNPTNQNQPKSLSMSFMSQQCDSQRLRLVLQEPIKLNIEDGDSCQYINEESKVHNIQDMQDQSVLRKRSNPAQNNYQSPIGTIADDINTLEEFIDTTSKPEQRLPEESDSRQLALSDLILKEKRRLQSELLVKMARVEYLSDDKSHGLVIAERIRQLQIEAHDQQREFSEKLFERRSDISYLFQSRP